MSAPTIPSVQPPARSRADRDNSVRAHRLRYRELIARIRDTVQRVVPAGASVLAISRGDLAVVDIEGRRVSHFPQNEHGIYAGYHPADSTAAITHLESLRSRGAEFLLIPATSLWWLDHYKQFRRHLERSYRVVTRDPETCVIFSLLPDSDYGELLDNGSEDRSYRVLVAQVRDVVGALLPDEATVAVVSGGDDALLSLGTRRGWHFPQTDRGVYAGHYPADSAAAIIHLEQLRAKGAEYFVIPRTACWWLTYYAELADHLARRCTLITRQTHICTIYALKPR